LVRRAREDYKVYRESKVLVVQKEIKEIRET